MPDIIKLSVRDEELTFHDIPNALHCPNDALESLINTNGGVSAAAS